MNLTMSIELAGFVAALLGSVFLVSARERRRLGPWGPYLLAILIVVTCLHFLDFLEWQGRDFADRIGDMLRIVIPVLWLAFAFEAYRAARESESGERFQQFRLILDQTQVPTVLLDDRGRIIDCSESFLSQSATLREEIVGRLPEDLSFIPGKLMTEAWKRSMKSEGAVSSETSEKIIWAGEELSVAWYAQRWSEPGTSTPGGVSIVLQVDHSQLDESVEAELSEASTVEVAIPDLRRSKGSTETNCALTHDLGNFLQIITGQAELLAFELDRQLRGRAMSISHAGRSAFEMVKALSRPDGRVGQRRIQVELVELVRSTVDLTQSTMPPNTRLIFETTTNAAPILADRIRLQRVLVNLILNARDAMPQGGTILVRLAVRDCEAQVRVIDEGGGIPPELQERVFDRYFTTKEVGKGTGVGLTVSQEIVSEHDGLLELVSSTPLGSEFLLTLPLYVEELASS